MAKKIKVCAIGGGTGTIPVLSGLKGKKFLDLSVIVSMTDDGGSNRVVRDEYGQLPVSDIRKSIIALSGTGNGLLRKLFIYRYSKGQGLEGHTLGNLIMVALTDMTGSEKVALDAASKLFQVKGKIIPVTDKLTTLCAKYDNGKEVRGEHLIDEPIGGPLLKDNLRIKKVFVQPNVRATDEALQAVLNSDYIVIGPGDLYTSILANVVIQGMQEVLRKTNAKLILVTNLITKKGQTQWMKLSDFVREIERYVGRSMDYILVNKTKIAKAIRDRYISLGEYPFADDLDQADFPNSQIMKTDLISNVYVQKQKGDKLKRSYLRHDEVKLPKAILKIISKNE